jgi:dihydrofolate reductase
MNGMRKYVVTRSHKDVAQQWNNSEVLDNDLIEAVRDLKSHCDLVVTGSMSVTHALMQADLVDEFRLLVFPIVLGEGARLFEPGTCTELELVDLKQAGAAALLTYCRALS